MIIAVDFDGTLMIDGKPNLDLMARLQNSQRQGTQIILWSCREGKRLAEAVSFCAKAGLRFNAINANVPEGIRRMGHDSRKVFADIYIDDKSIK
jgi:hypothetical protein